MYGTNFLQVSTESEEFLAYGWAHRLHSLGVCQALRAIWKNTSNSLDSNSDLRSRRFHSQQFNLDTLKISLDPRKSMRHEMHSI